MLAADFEFHTPSDLAEALQLLVEKGPGAKVLAGGMSMVPTINLGLLRPECVVSLNHVAFLDSVDDSGDQLRIGALVRHAQIASHPAIRAHAPALADAASVIGDVQVRNRGTIGGSVAHADPAADYLPVLVAFAATLVLQGLNGTRELPAREFFLDVMMTALSPDEIVSEIRVPKLSAGAGSGYTRLARVEGSFAIVNAAAVVDGAHCVIGIGGAVPAPVVIEVELESADVDEATLERVADAARDACGDAYDDLSGSADYRRAMAGVHARRVVELSLAARGGQAKEER
jgi:aerobic carbon-monoxide dehydrogenase medium subunit